MRILFTEARSRLNHRSQAHHFSNCLCPHESSVICQDFLAYMVITYTILSTRGVANLVGPRHLTSYVTTKMFDRDLTKTGREWYRVPEPASPSPVFTGLLAISCTVLNYSNAANYRREDLEVCKIYS